MKYITKGVRKLSKKQVQGAQVGMTPGFPTCCLNVEVDGVSKSLKISKKVAEVLVAMGLPYEG